MRAENDLVLIYGSKLTGVYVRAENDLFLELGSIDLVVVLVSKLTWFLYVGRKNHMVLV